MQSLVQCPFLFLFSFPFLSFPLAAQRARFRFVVTEVTEIIEVRWMTQEAASRSSKHRSMGPIRADPFIVGPVTYSSGVFFNHAIGELDSMVRNARRAQARAGRRKVAAGRRRCSRNTFSTRASSNDKFAWYHARVAPLVPSGAADWFGERL